MKLAVSALQPTLSPRQSLDQQDDRLIFGV